MRVIMGSKATPARRLSGPLPPGSYYDNDANRRTQGIGHDKIQNGATAQEPYYHWCGSYFVAEFSVRAIFEQERRLREAYRRNPAYYWLLV